MHPYIPSIAEYEKLKADTAEDRELIKHNCPCQILQRIEKLVTYYELNRQDPIMIYTALYHIGLVDGKRAERQRRNKSKEIACNE